MRQIINSTFFMTTLQVNETGCQGKHTYKLPKRRGQRFIIESTFEECLNVILSPYALMQKKVKTVIEVKRKIKKCTRVNGY